VVVSLLEDADAPLAQQLGVTPADVERRLAIVGFTEKDAHLIRDTAGAVVPHADALTAAFFANLSRMEEARSLMQDRDVLETAKRLKRDHIRAMMSGSYGLEYVEERLRLGALYAKAALDVRVFLGAFSQLVREIGARMMGDEADGVRGRRGAAGFDAFMSLQKVAFFDLSLIVDVIVAERERLIHLQQEALRELSTPVLQIRERLLILPIIGVVDTQRARQITESLLHAIRLHRAKVVVVDITGVPIVDSKVAHHLMHTILAAKLMGTISIVTGLSAEVAQALVTLGVNLGEVRTAGDLQGGLEEAERLLGYQVVEGAATAGLRV
jgi:rsbT co-antagonist protein RsbR